jgi:hypothetical protein
MAFQATCAAYILRMTIVAGSTLMTDPTIISIIWVRPGVGCIPVTGAVALCTIGPKSAAMEGRLGMACETVGRCAFVYAIHMA